MGTSVLVQGVENNCFSSLKIFIKGSLILESSPLIPHPNSLWLSKSLLILIITSCPVDMCLIQLLGVSLVPRKGKGILSIWNPMMTSLHPLLGILGGGVSLVPPTSTTNMKKIARTQMKGLWWMNKMLSRHQIFPQKLLSSYLSDQRKHLSRCPIFPNTTI